MEPPSPPKDKDLYSSFFHIYSKFLDYAVHNPLQKIRDFAEGQQSQNSSKWYHRQFRRVPTIDQCDVNDDICRFEANEQYKRDKLVDMQIVKILRQRRVECMHYWGADHQNQCRKVAEDYEDAATNYFIKHGDIRMTKDVLEVYMKQKHRMIWERRHPPQDVVEAA